MSIGPDSLGETPETQPVEAVAYERFTAISTLEGVILIAKYRVRGTVVEVETMYITKPDQPPDIEAGWQILHKDDNGMIIQRLLK